MKFNVTVDKKAEAAIDRRLCINCGECRENCPTGAIYELQKTAVCMKDGGNNGSFTDARRRSVEMACSAGCPLGIVPQAVASFIEKGELQSAADHIRERNPLPGICAAVCEHICRDVCKRTLFDDMPLNMKALEGYVLDKTEAAPVKYIRKYHEKVAVIGGGPAGLSAAYHMAKAGYGVTIFEKDSMLGGAVRWGIPAFRLDKELVKKEIERIVDAGIEVRCGWQIGTEHKLDEIWEEGYSACVIAAGESYGMMPELRGVDAEGIYDGVKVMRQLTGGEDEGAKIGDSVVVAGGGGFAADLAGVLKRMGKDVLCLAEEQDGDLQITAEIAGALADEGVEVKASTAIGQIITEGGKVKAVELIKIDYVEDERGRKQPHLVKGSGLNHFCDTVVFAAGQKSRIGDICNAETYPNGKIKIDDNYRTNKDRIFACGDVTGETSSVVEAIAAGKEAAAEVDKVLARAAHIKRDHVVYSAPDGLAMYPENIRKPIPQFEEKLINAILDEEDPFADDETGMAETVQFGELVKEEHVEDITAMLRSAGIEEEMPVFEFASDAKKAAVIGGGIAGITAAISLAKEGYKPVIFEKMPEIGGNLRWLATDKRIDKKLLENELKKVGACGIEIVCGVTAGVRPNIEALFGMGFDAVLFAVGEHGGKRYKAAIEGCVGMFDIVDLMGMISGNEHPCGLGDRVLVAGGDELTIDTARKLKESCKEVTVLAPYSRGVLHAKTGAVDAALDEGINFVTGVEVVGTECKDGKVYSAICKVAEKGYTINVPCDTLILGDGGPDTETIAIRNLKLDMKENGHIAVNHRLEASIPGVFSVGDLDMSAADAGRTGAAAVKNRLSGTDEYISVADPEKIPLSVEHEMIEGRHIDIVKGFEEGRRLFDCSQAETEASRCMGCGYHGINADMCMGCGICVKACPVNAVIMKPIDENVDDNKEVQPWQ